MSVGLLLVCFLIASARGCVIGATTLPSGTFSGTDNEGARYQVSLCDSIPCSKAGAAVCQNATINEHYSCGQAASREIHQKVDGVEVHFTNGSLCTGEVQRATVVDIVCAPEAPFQIVSVREVDLCRYRVDAKWAGACTACAAAGLRAPPPPLTFTSDLFDYSVNVCFPQFDGSFVVQQRRDSHLSYSLGTVAASKGPLELLFSEGDACVTGNLRETEVILLCNEADGIVNVTEVSICSYKMFIKTKQAC